MTCRCNGTGVVTVGKLASLNGGSILGTCPSCGGSATRRAIALLTSVIKSREPWSPACDDAVRAARVELDSTGGAA